MFRGGGDILSWFSESLVWIYRTIGCFLELWHFPPHYITCLYEFRFAPLSPFRECSFPTTYPFWVHHLWCRGFPSRGWHLRVLAHSFHFWILILSPLSHLGLRRYPWHYNFVWIPFYSAWRKFFPVHSFSLIIRRSFYRLVFLGDSIAYIFGAFSLVLRGCC